MRGTVKIQHACQIITGDVETPTSPHETPKRSAQLRIAWPSGTAPPARGCFRWPFCEEQGRPGMRTRPRGHVTAGHASHARRQKQAQALRGAAAVCGVVQAPVVAHGAAGAHASVAGRRSGCRAPWPAALALLAPLGDLLLRNRSSRARRVLRGRACSLGAAAACAAQSPAASGAGRGLAAAGRRRHCRCRCPRCRLVGGYQ